MCNKVEFPVPEIYADIR